MHPKRIVVKVHSTTQHANWDNSNTYFFKYQFIWKIILTFCEFIFWHAFNPVCTCLSQVALWIILAPSNVVNNPIPPFLWGGRSNSAEVVHQFSLHAEDLNFLASWCKKCYQVGDFSFFAWFLKCRISWRAWNLDSLKI